jgi:hypothetical protein
MHDEPVATYDRYHNTLCLLRLGIVSCYFAAYDSGDKPHLSLKLEHAVLYTVSKNPPACLIDVRGELQP